MSHHYSDLTSRFPWGRPPRLHRFVCFPRPDDASKSILIMDVTRHTT